MNMGDNKIKTIYTSFVISENISLAEKSYILLFLHVLNNFFDCVDNL